MSIEQDVLSALDNYSALTALVGARNYIVKLPQNPIYPNTVLEFQRIIENTLAGESSIEHVQVQIDVRDDGITDGYSTVRSVVTQVKAAMAAATTFKSLCIVDDDLPYDDDVETYRAVLRFSVWQ